MKTTSFPHLIKTEHKSCPKGRPLSVVHHVKLGGYEDVELILRFKKEMEILLSFSHPSLEKLISFLVSDDLKNISFEVCHEEEISLEEYIGTCPDAATRISLFIQLADVLTYVHSNNFIHKAISVKNIKVRQDKNAAPRLILKDAGRYYLYQSLNRNKSASDFLSTAPEQTGILKRRVDDRTDLYSAGIVGYFILTGKYPFYGDDIGSLISQHITKAPLKPTALNPELHNIFDSIVMKLLSKNPEYRYQSAKSLYEDLIRYKKKLDKGEYTGEFVLASTDIKILDFQTSLIGRKKEIEKLSASLTRASQKYGNFILISGENGCGKTRLLLDFRDTVIKQNGLFLPTGCSELKKTVPYKPIIDIFNIFAAKIMKYNEAKKDTKVREIKKILGDYKNIFLSFASSFENLFGEKHVPEKIYIEQDVNPLFEIFSNLLVLMASKKEPLVIFLDDIHNCDEGTLAFLSYFNRKIINLNMLVLCAYRPSKHLNAFVKKLTSYAQLQLDPLEKEDIRILINEIFHDRLKGSEKLSEDLFFKYSGNPFLTIEAIKLLIDQKVITNQKNSFLLSGYKINILPEDIFEIIDLRLPALSDDAKKVLSIASVLNEEFSIEVINSILGDEIGLEKIINAIDEALVSNFIWDVTLKEGIYGFIHETVRLHFYNSLSCTKKEEYHAKCSQYFEKHADSGRFESSFILAYHTSRAGLKDKAFLYLSDSAEKASQIFSYYEAVEYYREAIELLDTFEKNRDFTEKKVELILKYVYLTTNFGDFDDNIEKMLLCLELLKTYEIEKHRFEIIITLGRINFFKGNLYDSFNWYEKALAYSKEAKNDYYSGVAYKYLGLSHLFVSNDYLKAIRYLEKSVNCFGDNELVLNIEALSFLASSQAELGFFDDALSNVERAFEVIKKTDNPMKLSYVLHYASIIYNVMGDFSLSLFYSEKAYEIAVKNHDKLIEYSSLFSKAVALYHLGKYQSGIICAESALDIAVANNINLGIPLIYIILGACHLNTNPEKGIEIINRGEDIAKKSSDENAIQQANRYKGIGYRHLRNFDSSLSCLKNALKISDSLKLKPEKARNHLQLGLTYKSIGKESLSFDNIESAIEILEELKMKSELDRIKEIFKEEPDSDDEIYKKSFKEHTELITILKINKLALNINNIDILFEKILSLCINALGAQKGFLMVYDNNILNLKVIENFSSDNLSKNHILLSEGAIMHVEEYKEGVCINTDNAGDYLNQPLSGKVPSILCVPLFVREELFGVVYLENEFLPYVFNSGDLEILEVITKEASISIENALKLKEREEEIASLKKSELKIIKETNKQKAFTENMLNSSPLAVMSTTQGGDVTYLNNAMKRIIGVDSPGFNILEEGILNDEMTTNYKQALSGLGSTIESVRYVSKQKDEYYLNCTFIANRSNSGELSSVNLLFLDITEKVLAQQQVVISNKELSKLNGVAKAVNSTLDLETVLQSTLLMLKDLFPIDGFVIYLYDHDENAILYKKGLFPDKKNYSLPAKPIYLPEKYSRLLNVIEKKMFLHVKRVPSVLSKYFPADVKSCFFAPIEFKNEVIAIIQFFSVKKTLSINERESFFLASFINQIASAINNSSVYEKLSKALSDLEKVHKKLKEKSDVLTEDMHLAKKVQQGILPTDFSNITTLDIFLRYFPLQQVGGDLYDITKLDDDTIRIFICDATGHGVQAALTTMAIKTLYEKGKKTSETPAELLNYLSLEYGLIPDTGNLFTAFVADINIKKKSIAYSNAGHPYPVLVTKNGCEHLSGREMMIGLDYEKAKYNTYSRTISEEDKIFIFTDGLYEEFNSEVAEYGEKRLTDFLMKNKQLSLDELGKALIKDVENFMGRKPLNDDLCLIGVKIKV